MNQDEDNNDVEDPNADTVIEENEESWEQREQRKFDECCQKIKDNDMSLEKLQIFINDDDRAKRFGEALGRNSRLKNLFLSVEREVTLLGAQQIADSISRSSIQSILLQTLNPNTHDNILPTIYLQAMQTVRELKFDTGMSLHVDGVNLFQIAEHLATCQQLKSISFQIYPRVENFHALAEGIRASGLENVAISYYPVTNDEPFREAQSTFWKAAAEKLKHIRLPIKQPITDVLGNALVGNTSLETLEFPLHPFTPDHARRLANGIANSQIQCIRASGCEATAGSAENNIFYQGIAAAPNLKKLRIFPIMDYSQNLVTNVLHRLETLELCHLSLSNIRTVLSGIRDALLLKELALSFCHLNDADLEALAGGLRHLQITKLDLSHNEIGNQGAGRLLQLLTAVGLPIQELNMKYNSIGQEGACAMVEATVGTQLRALDLGRNLDVGFRGLALIAQSLPHLVLHKLCLSGVTENLWEAAPQPSLQLQQQSGEAWTRNIQHNQHIRVLGLKDAQFPSEVMKDIYFWVNVNKWRPFLQGELLFHGEWSHVIAKCQRYPWYAASLIYFLLKEDPANFFT